MSADEGFKLLFAKAVDELLGGETVCFDALCLLARQTLFRSVERWCAGDGRLKSRDCAEDIMQEIILRLLKTCIPGFLMRDGEVNYDPDGFKSWMFAVAKNIKSDYAKKYGNEPLYILDDEESPPDTQRDRFIADSAPSASEHDAVENSSVLRDAFITVMRSDSGVYKVLTWLTQALLMLGHDLSKKEANIGMEVKFSSMTLREMYVFIRGSAKRLEWLDLPEEGWRAIEGKLSEADSEGVILADKRYSEFYMTKGARASISDWVNRINAEIRRSSNVPQN